MSGRPIPAEMLDIFEEPALGNVAYRATDERLAIFPMWVSWVGEHLLTSTRVGAHKTTALTRPGTEVAVSIVSGRSPWRWLSLTGHVVDVRPDEGLAFMDSQSRRYLGMDYRDREHGREVLVVELDRVAISPGR